jgi:peptide/nickel transport system permease protein
LRLARYMTGKVLWGVVSLVAFLFFMYLAIELLIPGDIVSPLRLGMTGQELDALRFELGLDRPLPIRFWRWLTAFLAGRFEIGSFGPESGTTVFTALPSTLLVFTTGLLLSWSVGSWLGRFTAWRRGWAAPTVTFVGVLAYTMFPPFLAFVLGQFLADPIRSLQRAVVGDHRGLLWRDAPVSPDRAMLTVVGAIVVGSLIAGLIGWLLAGRWRIRLGGLATFGVVVAVVGGALAVLDVRVFALDVLFDAAIPTLAFAILTFGEFLLISQAAMVASQHDDYVLTARAKGIKDRHIRDRHVGRNASLVVLTRLAVSLPYLLTGLVIIEAAVGWHGVGTFIFTAVETQDMPVVMSALAVIGAFTLVARLVLDFVVAAADPRVTGVGPAEIQL